jgi:hypothetical protein
VSRVTRGALVGYQRGASRRKLQQVKTPPDCRRDLAMFEATDEMPRTELASRESNGITVTLLWSRSTNLVTVAVADTANHDYFELVLGEHERALDVFHHPFAHAAARGVEFRTRRPEPEVLLEAA